MAVTEIRLNPPRTEEEIKQAIKITGDPGNLVVTPSIPAGKTFKSIRVSGDVESAAVKYAVGLGSALNGR